MVRGWVDVGLGLCFLTMAAYMPQMRARTGRKPRHPAFRWWYLVVGLAMIAYGIVRML